MFILQLLTLRKIDYVCEFVLFLPSVSYLTPGKVHI